MNPATARSLIRGAIMLAMVLAVVILGHTNASRPPADFIITILLVGLALNLLGVLWFHRRRSRPKTACPSQARPTALSTSPRPDHEAPGTRDDSVPAPPLAASPEPPASFTVTTASRTMTTIPGFVPLSESEVTPATEEELVQGIQNMLRPAELSAAQKKIVHEGWLIFRAAAPADLPLSFPLKVKISFQPDSRGRHLDFPLVKPEHAFLDLLAPSGPSPTPNGSLRLTPAGIVLSSGRKEHALRLEHLSFFRLLGGRVALHCVSPQFEPVITGIAPSSLILVLQKWYEWHARFSP